MNTIPWCVQFMDLKFVSDCIFYFEFTITIKSLHSRLPGYEVSMRLLYLSMRGNEFEFSLNIYLHGMLSNCLFCFANLPNIIYICPTNINVLVV